MHTAAHTPPVPAEEPHVADRLELVILVGRLDRQMAGVRLDGERERAVGFRQGPSAAFGADHGVRHGLTGALLGDLAAEHDAAVQHQVDGLLSHAACPFQLRGGMEVGLLVGSGSPDIDAIARHDADPEPAFGIGLGGQGTDPALANSALLAGPADVDPCMSGRQAGVGIGHEAGEGPGRQQRPLQGLDARWGVGGDLDRLRGEPRSKTPSLAYTPRPMPRMLKRPWTSVVTGFGQPGPSWTRPHQRSGPSRWFSMS